MTLTQDWLAAIDGTNALAATIEFSRHGLLQHADPVDVARVMFEDADPVREFPSWPGKRNFEGKLWMASTAQHVPFESFWERSFLTSLDRPGDVVGVASQPMWIRWRSPRERELALIQAAGSTQLAVILTAIWEAVIYTVTAAILGTAATVIGGVIIAAKLGLSFPVISFSTLALIAAGGFILILAATVAPTIAALRREIPRTLAVE